MLSLVCYKGASGTQGPLGPPGPPGISVSSILFDQTCILSTLCGVFVHLFMFLFQQGPQGQKGSKGSSVSWVFILFSVLPPFVKPVMCFMRIGSFLIIPMLPCFLPGFTRSEGRHWTDRTTWTPCKLPTTDHVDSSTLGLADHPLRNMYQ